MKLQKSITKKFRSSRVKTLDVHSTKNIVVCGLYNGYVQTWNITSLKMLGEAHVSEYPIRTVKIVEKNGCVLIGNDEGKIHVYDLNTLRRLQSFDAHCDFIRQIEVHPSQEEFLTCSDDGTIKRWKFDKDIKSLATYVGHTHFVMDVKYYPKDTRKFISCSLDGTIKLWDLGQQKPIKTYKGHINGINSVSFIPNEDYFVSASDDLSVKVWELGSTNCIATLKGHTDNINSLYVFKSRIVSTSEDGTVRFWDSKSYQLKDTLTLNSGRVWEFREKDSTFIIGTDEDLIFMEIKSGSILSALRSSKIFYVLQNQIFTCKVEDSGILNQKLLSELDYFPTELEVSENGKSIALVNENTFTLYSSLGFRKKMTGSGSNLRFTSNTDFVVLDGSDINFYSKSEIIKSLKVEGLNKLFHLEDLLVGVFEDTTVFYDLEGKSLGSFDFPISNIAEFEDFFVAVRETNFLIVKRENFEIIKEFNYKIHSFTIQDDIFVFNSENKIFYLIVGENPFVNHLMSSNCHLIGLGENEIYILEDGRVKMSPFDREFINFQIRVLNKEDVEVEDSFRLKAISFFESLGLHDKALEICTNECHKFEILLRLNRLDEAYEIADSPIKYERLGKFYMKRDLKKAAECFFKAKDYRNLLFVDLLSSKKYLSEVAENCLREGYPNYSFIASLKIKDYEKCHELLKETPFGEIFRRTYLQ